MEPTKRVRIATETATETATDIVKILAQMKDLTSPHVHSAPS